MSLATLAPLIMLLEELKVRAKQLPPHLAKLWNCEMETQLHFADGTPMRIPHNGNEDPNWYETAYYPPIASLTAFGVSGWNWAEGYSCFVTLDLDSIVNHTAGHDAVMLDGIIQKLYAVPQAEIIRSKSGNGYHVRVYFDPDNAPRCGIRDDHSAVGQRALKWLSKQIEEDLNNAVDCVGVIAWIHHSERGEKGMELLKESSALMPADWSEGLDPEPSPTKLQDILELPSLSANDAHQVLISYLELRKLGEWKDARLVTHTSNLAAAKGDKSLGIKGKFDTVATGKDGPSDRNCFAFPAEDGSWRVFRFGKGAKEHRSWLTSQTGWTWTFFNREKEPKRDFTAEIVAIGLRDEVFRDTSTGASFVSTTERGIKECLPIQSSRYRHLLRLRFTDETGCVAKKDHLSNAVDQLEAEATRRAQFPVSIRVAAHEDALYIDTADTKRDIIKVTKDGYSVVSDAPVRFFRPQGLLPLPLPVPGGTVKDVAALVNVAPEDMPLLLAALVGIFHPTGPYPVLQICGEHGSAKSGLAKFIHSFTDPHEAIGNSMPKDPKDLMVVAKSRWLVSFDNLSTLPRSMSDYFAMLATGSAISGRKLYSDDEVASMKAKRPIMVTSITNVIEASDLLDRTITFVLPVIPPDQRRTEVEIEEALNRNNNRGKILGLVLDGVVTALAGHRSVKLLHMPRMADFVTWATAAEKGLRLKSGSVLEAYMRTQAEESTRLLDSEFAQKIVELCLAGFRGTPTQLTEVLELKVTATKAANQLRECAPDLRRAGYTVVTGKSNGTRYIELGPGTAA